MSSEAAELYHDERGLFKKGNPGGGRPRKVSISDKEAAAMVRMELTEYGSIAEAARVIFDNAFRKENQNGSKGSIAWAKLAMQYMVGPPTVRVEQISADFTDLVRMQVRQRLEEINTVDVQLDERDIR